MPIELKHGHADGVAFHVGYKDLPDTQAKDIQHVTFELHSKARLAEFHDIIQRALNCMDKPPEWAVDYMDFVTGTPAPAVPRNDGPHPNNDPPTPAAPAEVSVPYCQLEDERKQA
jgi:hypothetical protein